MTQQDSTPNDENEISKEASRILADIGSSSKPLSSDGISTSIKDKNARTVTITAARLAISLWIMLAGVIVWNI